jgi:cellobiose phosphorylase
MLQSESVEGVKAEGDKLIFVPASISHVTGRIAKLALTNAGLLLDFEGQQKNKVVANSKKGAKEQGSK